MNRCASHSPSVAFLLSGALALAGCSTAPTQEAPAPGARAAATAQAAAQASAVPNARASESDAAITKRSIYYAFDQYDVRAQDQATVQANAQYLRAHPNLKARIEGNADERGSREYNLALGQRRAEGVMKMMSLLGVPESRMESVSFGKEKPRALTHDEAAWSENRRSDIVY